MVEPNENLYKNSFLDEIQLFSYNEQEEPNENCENKAIKFPSLIKSKLILLFKYFFFNNLKS